eukprot:CAMPEP_0194136942 /NCGR_PEP_ID=MMETSP0152-20130528/6883_1 /TAXON_ID=1049557 /ORGANISM="Thalassiothrix antarctica, Strain L6-D1" /LENGTH=168 /DNA_ID=CAMNT_0038833773 /DNA_START=21 /DNA_END=527 /DNA_ORIENTATION=+
MAGENYAISADEVVQAVALEVEGTADEEDYPKTDGLGIGYALVPITIVGLLFQFTSSSFGMGDDIAAIVLSSILICRCCCAADYKLSPKTRKYAVILLNILCGQFLCGIIIIAMSMAGFDDMFEAFDGQELDPDFDSIYLTLIRILLIVGIVLDICAIIFACLYTWHR